ncbi:MAG: T9SS type A sorting domain-containing protein [Ignavibacteriales bacterium]|nr:T9SS type A sorting domain-containing protein [Ignavibacteriales bacterium]
MFILSDVLFPLLQILKVKNLFQDFKLPTEQNVELKLFDILGSEVKTILNELMPAGFQSVVLTTTELTSGVYLYRLKAGNFTEIKKMVVAK